MNAPTVGGILYVTIASIALGMTVGSVRWLIIDTIRHRTGISQPEWDFSRLQENIMAYRTLIEIHYHYYQFFANGFIALTFVYIAKRLTLGFFSSPLGWSDLAFLLVGTIYFVASRDSLGKYYTRVEKLLGTESGHATGRDDPLGKHAENRLLNSNCPMNRLNLIPDQMILETSRGTIRQETVAQ